MNKVYCGKQDSGSGSVYSANLNKARPLPSSRMGLKQADVSEEASAFHIRTNWEENGKRCCL